MLEENNNTFYQIMTHNQSINQVVWLLLQKDLAVQKDLTRGLMNTRALAKYLIQKHGLTASIDAVISAIRRFENQNVFEENEKNIGSIFQDAIVSTRNNIRCLIVKIPFPALAKRIAAINQVIDYKLVTGKITIRVLIDTLHFDTIKSVFA